MIQNMSFHSVQGQFLMFICSKCSHSASIQSANLVEGANARIRCTKCEARVDIPNPHLLSLDAEDGQFVRFKCAKCAAICNFDTKGEPAPINTVDGWQHPENPEQWMGVCDAA